MRSREEVHAFRFVTRRISSAVLSGEPETNDLPMRRLGLATFASVMIAAIVLAAVGVIGFVLPGGRTNWRDEGSIIVEKETGSRLVFRGGRLYPVLNYTSARLIVGRPDVPTSSVSRNSLAGTPRGSTFGIPGAPDLLPGANQLLTEPWNVCAGTGITGQNGASGAGKPMVAVLVGDSPGGRRLGGSGVLAQVSGGDKFLLWNNRKLAIADDKALASLGWTATTPIKVSAAFANAVPSGPDLAAPKIPGAGGAGPTVNGQATKIGDVFQIGSTDQFQVVVGQALAPITPTGAKLMLAGSTPRRLDPAAYQSAPHATDSSATTPAGFPTGPVPQLAGTASENPTVCAAVSAKSGTDVVLSVLDTPPAAFTDRDPAVPVAAAKPTSATADRVVVPGGRGAVVRAVGAPGATTGTLYLITDSGLRYPVAGQSDLAALGFGQAKPVSIFTSVVNLLPIGPTLSCAAARKAPQPTPSSSSGADTKPAADTPTGAEGQGTCGG